MLFVAVTEDDTSKRWSKGIEDRCLSSSCLIILGGFITCGCSII